jgi:hypothetical protein
MTAPTEEVYEAPSYSHSSQITNNPNKGMRRRRTKQSFNELVL